VVLAVGSLKSGLTSKPANHAVDRPARNVAAIQPVDHQGVCQQIHQKPQANCPRKKKTSSSEKRKAQSELTISIKGGSVP